MSIATKVAALLVAVRRQDVEELSPAERQRLASLCRHIAAIADSQSSAHQRSAVICEFNPGRRA
jgi:hypothetical protein